MNVIEAYISFKKQLIIIISGLAGCGKTSVAKRIAKNFKINYIDQNDYYIKDFKNPITTPNNEEINNPYTDDAINWTSFNEDVNAKKSSGIVINAFTTTNINFDVDIHIHLSLSKQQCIDNRHKYLTKHKDKFKKEFEEIDSQLEKWKFNHLNYPYYLATRKNMTIDNMINVTEKHDTETFNEVWDLIINEYIIPFTKKFSTQNKGKDYREWKESQNKPVTISPVEEMPIITPVSDNEDGVHLIENLEELPQGLSNELPQGLSEELPQEGLSNELPQQDLPENHEDKQQESQYYTMSLDPTDTLNNDTL